MISLPELQKLVRQVPDFPKPGILFQDFAPLLMGGHLAAIAKHLEEKASTLEYDCIGGIESRGFIFGAALAALTGRGLVTIRKPGKLPPPTRSLSYALEYGRDTLEMHAGSGKMLIVDDVFATGGTMQAAAELAQDSGYHISGLLVVLDLRLRQDFAWKGHVVRSLWTV